MKPRPGDGRYVALLRGINVGGHRILPMSELREIFIEAGATDVETYIQSGNVVFATPVIAITDLVLAAANAIEARFGFRPSLMARTHQELAAAVKAHPFAGPGEDKSLHVGFLASAPKATTICSSEHQRIAPDRAQIIGRELYLYCPNGMSATKIDKKFLSRLETECTVRNWRTVNKLTKMSASA